MYLNSSVVLISKIILCSEFYRKAVTLSSYHIFLLTILIFLFNKYNIFNIIVGYGVVDNIQHAVHPAYEDNTSINIVDLALYEPFGITAFSQQNSKQTK